MSKITTLTNLQTLSKITQWLKRIVSVKVHMFCWVHEMLWSEDVYDIHYNILISALHNKGYDITAFDSFLKISFCKL